MCSVSQESHDVDREGGGLATFPVLLIIPESGMLESGGSGLEFEPSVLLSLTPLSLSVGLE